MSIACLEKYRLDSYRGLRNEYLDALNAEQIFTVTEFLMRTPEDIMRVTMMDHNVVIKSLLDCRFHHCLYKQ